MNRVRVMIGAAVAAAATLCVAGPAVARPAASCKRDDAKPTVHNEAVRREQTLAQLAALVAAQHDEWGLNAGETSALRSASAAIVALDEQIQRTCYATVAAFHADASKLFTDYRVYWLRVPQAHVLDASNRLGVVDDRLEDVAKKLEHLVGTNAKAKTDLDAMKTALAAGEAKLGPAVAPGQGAGGRQLGSDLASAVALQPASDMTADDQALVTARNDLQAIRTDFLQARAAGKSVVADLHG